MPADMKMIIADAFREMTHQKNVDKITVKDLVEACHISRQTFYYHFQDIMDVIEWSVQQAMQKTLEQGLQISDGEEVMRVFVSSAYQNRTMILRLLASQRRAQIEKMFIEALRVCLRELYRSKASKVPVYYEDLEIWIDFYSLGISTYLIEKCLMGQIDEREVAHQLYRLITGKIRLAVPEEGDGRKEG